MVSELYTAECAPECGFKVQDHDKSELTKIVQLHAKGSHKKDMTEKDVLGMMKTVRA